MTWDEAKAYMKGPEINGGVHAKVRREAWRVGQWVEPGGSPLFHMDGPVVTGITRTGFSKVVSPSPSYMRCDTWKPTEEDLAATDWILL